VTKGALSLLRFDDKQMVQATTLTLPGQPRVTGLDLRPAYQRQPHIPARF
jgi:hypothetical protein